MAGIRHLIERWQNVRARLIETMAKFSESELDFRAFPASWTVRQLMLHIAQEENGEFNYGLTQTLSEFPPAYDPGAYVNCGALQSLLQDVHAPSLQYLETLTDEDLDRVVDTPWGAPSRLIEIVDHLIEHEIHHRAELSLILGVLGKQGLNA